MKLVADAVLQTFNSWLMDFLFGQIIKYYGEIIFRSQSKVIYTLRYALNFHAKTI